MACEPVSGPDAAEVALRQACEDAFNRFYGKRRQLLEREWDAFRCGWVAAELHALLTKRAQR